MSTNPPNVFALNWIYFNVSLMMFLCKPERLHMKFAFPDISIAYKIPKIG